MAAHSLRRRLLLTATASTIAALTVAGLALSHIFQTFATQRVVRELDSHLGQLAGAVEFASSPGVSLVRDLADPKFEKPLSGLYWQVNSADGPVLRSRSLWDGQLKLDTSAANDFGPFLQEVGAPAGDGLLLLRGRTVSVGSAGAEKLFHLLVAIDRKEIDAAHREFIAQLVASLAVLAGALILAAWLQISVGLRPLNLLRQQVDDIQTGAAERLRGDFPSEVDRLAGKMNSLLDAQEKSMERARARAGNLAHGLKTPLAVLSAESRALRKKGQAEPADEVDIQIEHMRRNVERELARSRERLSNGQALTVVPSAVRTIVSAMKRLPRGAEITWSVDVPEDLAIPVHEDDFNDVVGNLLDNARKWAAKDVQLSVLKGTGDITLQVQDDGPGVPDDQKSLMLERGHQIDPGRPGAGLGLAIVQDVLDVYGGELTVQNGSETGLLASVRLPV